MQDNFKNINNATPSLPFDDVWADLKPELDKEAARREKLKRRFVIFWLSLVVIGFGSGALFMVYRPSSIVNSVVRVGDKEKILNSEHQTRINEIKKEQVVTNVENEKQGSLLKNEEGIKHIKQGIMNVGVEAKTKGEFLNKKQKRENKKQFISSKANAFENVKSFTNLSQYKRENKLTSSNKNLVDDFINDAKNNLDITSNLITAIDTAVSSKDSVKAKAIVSTTNLSKISKPKLQTKTKFSYGLQWNVPVLDGANFLDINTINKPITLFIPQVWISKTFGKKHSLMLAFNPYSQYYFNNKAVVDFNKYNVTINTGSQAITKPQDITYTEATAFNKLIAIEASLMYQYQLLSKIKIGVGISCNWLQGALMQNKVVKNYTLTTRDSLYGIDKSNKEWSYLNSSYMLGKFEVQYQTKRMNFGVCFSKPISNVFVGNNQYRTPINTNLFVRWSIK